MLAQQYCCDCKTSFEELSKIIQKVLVSRKELIAYNRKQSLTEAPMASALLYSTDGDSNSLLQKPLTSISGSNKCYGCSSAATEHCLTLLRALSTQPAARQLLCQKGLIQELLWNNLRRGTVQVSNFFNNKQCYWKFSSLNDFIELHSCGLIIKRVGRLLNTLRQSALLLIVRIIVL